MAEIVADHLSPQVLAYVGDAVHDLFVRSRLARTGLAADRLHRAVVAHVRAGAQAGVLGQLEAMLTDDERLWLKRGRNLKGASAERRRSTALEALFGWLYLTDQASRLQTVLEVVYAASLGQEGGDECQHAPST